MEKKFELVEDDTLLVHNCNGDIKVYCSLLLD